MVPPVYEARVYFPRTGGVISSKDKKRESYLAGREVRYRVVPAYKCEQIEGVSYYDFEFIKFKVILVRGYYRVVVDKDESRQDIRIWVEGLGFYEGRNLGGSFKQFPAKRPSPKKTRKQLEKPKTVKPIPGKHKIPVKPLKQTEIKKYSKHLSKSKKDGCLVTVIMPAVARVETTKKTVTGLVRNANFPHIFKAIIHPDRVKLIKWLKKLGIEVIQKHYFPIVKVKSEMVKLCKTKYMLMMDNDIMPISPLNPMLDFMETHPKVGVCATALEGTSLHGVLHYGAEMSQKGNILEVQPLVKKLPYSYCNYIHHGCTMFRMKLFEEVAYDLAYPGQGYEHEDIFLQIAQTKWKVVSYNAVAATPLWERGPKWYKKLRGKNIAKSRTYFRDKWGIKKKERV